MYFTRSTPTTRLVSKTLFMDLGLYIIQAFGTYKKSYEQMNPIGDSLVQKTEWHTICTIQASFGGTLSCEHHAPTPLVDLGYAKLGTTWRHHFGLYGSLALHHMVKMPLQQATKICPKKCPRIISIIFVKFI